MKSYDHKKIESKWQKEWEKKKIYQAKNTKGKKFYGLIEFPYPSGAGLHVGHIRSNTAMDIISRKRRMEGYNVLYPIGYDAFGLPTENYAIKTGIPPAKVTKQNADTFRRQLKSLGFSFDWSREINTTDPAYYKWTQWIFLQMFKKGLAYKSKATINWCPKDKIGLANEEVVDGKCERCGTAVEKREKEQWMLAITKYAERLDKDLDDVDYLERIKTQQRNWIGKSEGSEIEFKLSLPPDSLLPTSPQGRGGKIVILHGRSGTPENNFYPWLKKELEKVGYEVYLPAMPNTKEPNDEEQANYVIKNVPLDENTIIISHSFGGVVAMRILEKGKRIKGLIQFSTPITGKFIDNKKRQSVSDAVAKGFDYEKIKKQANFFRVIFDLNDNIVPKNDIEILSKNLGIKPQPIKSKIAHFCAEEEPEMLEVILKNIAYPQPLSFGEGLGGVSVKVFTTRADTLFGATYVVLAPEHTLVRNLLSQVSNKDEVKKYISDVRKKSEMDRTAEGKEKTGVELKGVKAINPANEKEIPVWIADYVLPQYGTGAVMAVPAHDERDFEFAKKYGLPIVQVVAPHNIDKENPPREGEKNTKRNIIHAIVEHPTEEKIISLKWKDFPWKTLITGGIENDETPEQAAEREIIEETGFLNLKYVKTLPFKIFAEFYAHHKKVNRAVFTSVVYFKLKDLEKKEVSKEEKKLHEVEWINLKDIGTLAPVSEMEHIVKWLKEGDTAYTEEGVLINSSKFNELTSEEARKKITEAVGGKMVTKFKLRDWIFSRQRYWGEPIPIINCGKCGYVPVPENDLPVKLPEVKNYKPTDTGESPLSAISKWVNVKCPICKGPAKRETDTMPNWAGSSWYYLRYTDPKNKKEFASMKNLKYWTPVDWYNGGMEHVTLHLLYSRFWHKFLYDMKLVPTKEPYMKRTAHGMISAEGGEKMSKSKGNIVNPDNIVKLYGADTLRLYEMFIGPFEQTVVWNTDSIIGPRRFLEKVWKLGMRVASPDAFSQVLGSPRQILLETRPDHSKKHTGEATQTLLHKTIKKVSEDIENMNFNTAVSAMMVLVNEMEKLESIDKKDFKIFLQLLAPFAPHIAEELWITLEEKKSIHLSAWPKYDPKKVVEEKVKIAIQINGKLRGEMIIDRNMSEVEIKKMALKDKAIIPWVEGKEVKRIIYVTDRLVNIVN